MLRITLMVAFAFFAPFFGEGGSHPWMIFCLSVSTVWVFSTQISVGNTQTLVVIIEFVWTFCTQRWKLKHCPCTLPHPHPSHPAKLSLSNIKRLTRRQRWKFCSYYCFVFCFNIRGKISLYLGFVMNVFGCKWIKCMHEKYPRATSEASVPSFCVFRFIRLSIFL